MDTIPDKYRYIIDSIDTYPVCVDFTQDSLTQVFQAGTSLLNNPKIKIKLAQTLRYPETSLPKEIAFMMQSLLLENIVLKTPGDRLRDLTHPHITYIIRETQGTTFTIESLPSKQRYTFTLEYNQGTKKGRSFYYNDQRYDEFSLSGSLKTHIPRLHHQITHDTTMDNSSNTEQMIQHILADTHDLEEICMTDTPGPLKKHNPYLRSLETRTLETLIRRLSGLGDKQKKHLQQLLTAYTNHKNTHRFKRTEYQGFGDDAIAFYHDIHQGTHHYDQSQSMILDLLHGVSRKFQKTTTDKHSGKKTQSMVCDHTGVPTPLYEVPSLRYYMQKNKDERTTIFLATKPQIDLEHLPEMLRDRYGTKQAVIELFTKTEQQLNNIHDHLANLQTV